MWAVHRDIGWRLRVGHDGRSEQVGVETLNVFKLALQAEPIAHARDVAVSTRFMAHKDSEGLLRYKGKYTH